MKKETIIVSIPIKRRNPFNRSLVTLGHGVVRSKKGKGSYQRVKKIREW